MRPAAPPWRHPLFARRFRQRTQRELELGYMARASEAWTFETALRTQWRNRLGNLGIFLGRLRATVRLLCWRLSRPY